MRLHRCIVQLLFVLPPCSTTPTSQQQQTHSQIIHSVVSTPQQKTAHSQVSIHSCQHHLCSPTYPLASAAAAAATPRQSRCCWVCFAVARLTAPQLAIHPTLQYAQQAPAGHQAHVPKAQQLADCQGRRGSGVFVGGASHRRQFASSSSSRHTLLERTTCDPTLTL